MFMSGAEDRRKRWENGKEWQKEGKNKKKLGEEEWLRTVFKF